MTAAAAFLISCVLAGPAIRGAGAMAEELTAPGEGERAYSAEVVSYDLEIEKVAADRNHPGYTDGRRDTSYYGGFDLRDICRKRCSCKCKELPEKSQRNVGNDLNKQDVYTNKQEMIIH